MLKKWHVLWALLVLVAACQNTATQKDGAIRVGEKWIKNDEIAQVAQMLSGGRAGDIFEGMDTTMLRQAAKQLVAHYLMLHEAKQREMTVDSTRLENGLKAFRQKFPDEASYQRALTATGQTEQTIRAQMSEQLMVDNLVKESLLGMDSISDSACKAFYTENKDRFASKKEYRLSQIFFRLPGDASEEQSKAIEQKASETLKKVKNGSDFSAVAREVSEGPERKDGGDLGWFAEGDLMPALDSAAQKLKKGQVSGVIQSGVGLHLVRKVDEKVVAAQPYDSVKNQIALNLEIRNRNTRIQSLVDSLAHTGVVEYANALYDDLFATTAVQ